LAAGVAVAAGAAPAAAAAPRSWSAILKKELVHGRTFRSHVEARLASFEWIEVWYQRKRIHGSIGYVSPEAFEAAARAG
jgi:transposase InsO family protein